GSSPNGARSPWPPRPRPSTGPMSGPTWSTSAGSGPSGRTPSPGTWPVCAPSSASSSRTLAGVSPTTQRRGWFSPVPPTSRPLASPLLRWRGSWPPARASPPTPGGTGGRCSWWRPPAAGSATLSRSHQPTPGLSPAAVEGLLAACQRLSPYPWRDRSALQLVAATGCRISQLVQITLGDLAPNEPRLSLPGPREPRVVPLDGHTLRVLR